MWILTILSLTVLLWLIILFIKNNKRDYWSIAGLFTKILAGIALGLIYKYYYGGGDTFQYFSEAQLFFNFILDQPEHTFSILFNTLSFPDLMNELAYADQPRALLFSKIVTIFYFLSGGNYWLIGILLSFVSFICAYLLVRELVYLSPINRRIASISFYFLPTFVFWTSGLLKESLAIGALLILIASCLKMIRVDAYGSPKSWIVILFASFILWELKYFYAAVAFPLLGTLLLFRFLNRSRKVPVSFIPGALAAGILIVSTLHYNLNFSHLYDVIYQNYLLGIGGNLNKAIQYYHFDGNWIGYLINAPLALFSGLFRPLPFESSGFLPLLAGIENLTVLLLFVIGFWRSGFKLKLKNPIVLICLIYIVCLAILIAFSTPNFGTLSRYKVAYWPFFVLLVLTINKKSQAPKSLTL